MKNLSTNLNLNERFSADFISSLQALQQLSVRLYFSDELQSKIINDREATLDFHSVTLKHRKFIADPNCPNFQAECWGRRTMVAREIANRYVRFFTAKMGSPKNIGSITTSRLFSDFLSSNYFLTPEYSTTHPYGMGIGYENVSKFFRWAIRPENQFFSSDPDARNMIYFDFAIYLLAMCKHSKEKFFERVGKAIVHIDQVSPDYSLIITSTKVIRVSRLRDHPLLDLTDLAAG